MSVFYFILQSSPKQSLFELIHSINNFFWLVCYVPGTVQGAELVLWPKILEVLHLVTRLKINEEEQSRVTSLKIFLHY